MRICVLLLLGWMLWLPAGAQVDFAQYRSQLSEGTLPAGALEVLHRDPTRAGTMGYREEYALYRAEKVNYLRHVQYAVEELFSQGLVLFNDTTSRYVNRVALNLIQRNPTLMSELRFFLIKSPAINSFVTENGLVFLTMGLVAGCHSEAELAWCISRCIVHYIQQHRLQSHEVFLSITEPNSRRLPSLEQRLMGRRLYNANDQIVADTAALNILTRAGYKAEEAERGLLLLGSLYAPYDDLYFTPSFWENEYLRIPPEMLAYQVPELAPDKQPDGHISRFASPDQRRKAMDWAQVRHEKKLGKLYLSTEKEFAYINKIARYELCLLYLAYHMYPRALYQAYLLGLNDFNNPFLEQVQLRATYGLAVYALQNRIDEVAPEPDHLTGQVSQVYHLFRRLQPTEVAGLSLHTIGLYLDFHHTDTLAPRYARHLATLLKQYHWDRTVVSSATPNAQPEDFADSLAMTEFCLNALAAHTEHDWFLAFFEEPDTTVMVERKGFRIPFIGKKDTLPDVKLPWLHLLPPTYSLIDHTRKDPLMVDRAYTEGSYMLEAQKQSIGQVGLPAQLMDPTLLERDSMTQYNRLGQLHLWLQERTRGPEMEQMVPELVQPLRLEQPYIGHMALEGIRQPRRHRAYVLAGSVLVAPLLPAGVYYYATPSPTFYLHTQGWNTVTGRRFYNNESTIKGEWWRHDLLQANLYYQLLTLKNLNLARP